MPEIKAIVVSIVSDGVGKDGGGFIIINGKLRRIPPRSPKFREIEVAVSLLAQAESLDDKKGRLQLTELSESLIATNVSGLVEELGK